MLRIFSVVTILVCAQAYPALGEENGLNKTIIRNINERIAEDGYYSESHFVVTSDWYILEINRIPLGRNESKDTLTTTSKPVVFVMHGLQNSAISFIALGPELSIAYNLADNGFDVWLGNARGVLNSRNHIFLNPDDPKDRRAFFDYTFEDIGMKDLPTMIDYILAHTKRQQLHYIGHSQGGTSFLVLNSMLPEYNQKFISAHLLAGVGYQYYFPSRILSHAAIRTDFIYNLAVRMGLIEIFGPSSIDVDASSCDEESRNDECGLANIRGLLGELGNLQEMLGGASIKQYAHYGQNIRDRTFMRWDYGLLGNLFKYGRFSPPSYRLSSITADVTMHYTLNDILLDERDVRIMALVIRNAKTRREKKIAQDGFYSETHKVTTSDGYILELNRIPFGRNDDKNCAGVTSKPVTMLMHGLHGAAVSYILLGPEKSIAYNLADNCFDVWLGTARGIINSRYHVSLNPDDPNDQKEFFDFSFEDIGMKDLPAMIDYILNQTGKSQLHYIGHSQGGTNFLVLTSMLPEYNQKIASAHLLAGIGYQSNFPNKILRLAAYSSSAIYAFAVRLGLIEILGPEWNNINIGECTDNNEACDLISVKDAMSKIFGPIEILAGASIKQYAHYGQNIHDKQFRRWYYNPITNLIKYGSLVPPTYNISGITADVTLHYTMSDELQAEQDVLAMAETMANCKTRRVPRDGFSHNDFVAADDAKELVTDYIIEELKKYDN
ncbi:unnamed protein product, partial [Brenthis ino]